jgi:hypothetical protein
MKNLKYEVEGLLPEPVKLSLKDELMITEDIDSEVDKASHNYGFYAVLGEKAESRYQKLKYAYEVWHSTVEKDVAAGRAEKSEKAFTGPQMAAFVKSRPKYHAYQKKLTELDEHRRILKIVAKAFEMKGEMVRTKSSNRRVERGR